MHIGGAHHDDGLLVHYSLLLGQHRLLVICREGEQMLGITHSRGRQQQ